jgi:hypothetical protein
VREVIPIIEPIRTPAERALALHVLREGLKVLDSFPVESGFADKRAEHREMLCARIAELEKQASYVEGKVEP